ncbi:MAG: hypothetical protein ACYC92_15600 [Candidatus Acidiferrales bacterium]
MMIYRRAMGIPIVSLLSILPTVPAFAQQLPPSHPGECCARSSNGITGDSYSFVP